MAMTINTTMMSSSMAGDAHSDQAVCPLAKHDAAASYAGQRLVNAVALCLRALPLRARLAVFAAIVTMRLHMLCTESTRSAFVRGTAPGFGRALK
jgi:hypothetical protein